jgi:DMSO reductase family type II enzyme heme b subunit
VSTRWLAIGIALSALFAAAPAAGQDASAGKATYDKWCAECHGEEGAGDGSAATYMLPQPRDFTTGLYQIRTTPTGELPTDDDILRMIDEGMPGSAMPGWKEYLSDAERNDLVQYLKTFSPFFEDEAPSPVEYGGPPGVSEEGLAEGREFYDKIECWKCHGQAGRGDGPSAPTLEDDWDLPIRAADLTEGWNFNGGHTTEAIFARLMTGLNGAPMPSFADLIDAEFMTEEQLWRVAQYVKSLSPETPEVREVIRAALVETLPTSVDDVAWDVIERFYIPLVGQIIIEPRWFAPTVDGVWAQAAHDGQRIALRLTWNDPSESPDPQWEEWRQRVVSVMEPSVEATDELLSDALTVQFPTTIPEGMKRPYFLMGAQDEPVYLLSWNSGGGTSEALGRGMNAIDPIAGESTLTSESTFDQGQWRLSLSRALAVEGADRLAIETGRPIPMAIFAWDGSNGESGTRGAISTWYFLYLDQPTENITYAFPVAAVLLTAVLGLVIVARAQRGADSGGHEAGSD